MLSFVFVEVLIRSLPRWFTENTELIKFLEFAVPLALLFIKKVRVTLLKLLLYLYNNIPFMKRIAWLETQMIHKNEVLDKLLAGQDVIKNELTSNGGTSLKDSVKNIESKVTKLRAVQKRIEDGAGYATMELDENGQLTSCNQTLIDWSERNREELAGKGYINIFHADDRQWVNKQIAEAIFDNRECDIEPRLQVNSVAQRVRIVASPIIMNTTLIGYTVTLKKL